MDVDVSHIADATEVPEGRVYALSGSPGYTCLLAMIAAGDARYNGDQFFTDGTRAVMAEVLPAIRRSANPEQMHLIIDPNEFQRALDEYREDWRLVWWREAIQNAVDAKSSQVALSVEEEGDFVVASCEDNGIGMDKDTLQNKFLALGGTTKGTSGSIGGFGVAKKILCFRWPKWAIHTRDHLLTGKDSQIEYEQTDLRRGTLLKVWMPKETGLFTRTSFALEFLERCNLPRVAFTLDGTPFRGPWLRNGSYVRELEGERATAKVYYTKESKLLQGACYVRTVEGLFMHSRYLSSEVRGYVIIELVPKTDPKTGQPYASRDYLTSNRDDVRDPALNKAIGMMLNEIAADVKSALKAKHVAKVKKFMGTGGKFKPEVKEKEATIFYNMETSKRGDAVRLTDESAKKIGDIVSESQDINRMLADLLLKSSYTGTTQIETALKQISQGYWRRDFLIYPEPELAQKGFAVPKKFDPEHQPPILHKLARVWADLCMYVMVALNSPKQYGVGWLFSEDEQACHLKDEQNENWLLLNPYIIDRKALERLGLWKGTTLKDAEIWSPADKEHLHLLYALAIHECTHFADDLSYHSESFSSALTYNTSLAGEGFKYVEKIARAARVVARKEREGPPEGQTAQKGRRNLTLLEEVKRLRANLGEPNFYPLNLGAEGEFFRVLWEEPNPDPYEWLYMGNSVVARNAAGGLTFVYLGDDGLGTVTAALTPEYADLSGRQIGWRYPTLLAAATDDRRLLLRLYGFIKGRWKSPKVADADADVEIAIQAAGDLRRQLFAEAQKMLQELTPEAASDLANWARLYFFLLSNRTNIMCSVEDGLSVYVDRLLSELCGSGLEQTAYLARACGDAGAHSGIYVADSHFGVPFPDMRRDLRSCPQALFYHGCAFFDREGGLVEFYSMSGVHFRLAFKRLPRALASTDFYSPTAIVTLMGMADESIRWQARLNKLHVTGWGNHPEEGYSFEEVVAAEFLKELRTEVSRIKKRPEDFEALCGVGVNVLEHALKEQLERVGLTYEATG